MNAIVRLTATVLTALFVATGAFFPAMVGVNRFYFDSQTPLDTTSTLTPEMKTYFWIFHVVLTVAAVAAALLAANLVFEHFRPTGLGGEDLAAFGGGILGLIAVLAIVLFVLAFVAVMAFVVFVVVSAFYLAWFLAVLVGGGLFLAAASD